LTTDQIYVATIIAPTIISGFKVTDIKAEESEAVVTVKYYLVGYSENFASFEQRLGSVERKVFLKKIDRKWTIVSQIFPHMYAGTVIDHLRRAQRRAQEYLNSVVDPEKRSRYEEQVKYETKQREVLIEQIKKASARKTGSD